MQLRFAALLLLTACSIPTADAETDSSNETYGGIGYSCEGVTAAPQLATVDSTIVAPWHALAKVHDPDAAWSLRVRDLAFAKPPVMTTEERVRLQHELLPIATQLQRLQLSEPYNANHRIAQAAVLRLIKTTAPTADELEWLGSGARPRVAAILGSGNEIVERATSNCGTGRLRHVNTFHGLLAFRPLRTEHARALVAQLVAFDNEGKPHITPLVEGIEMRLGNEATSPACVVEAAPDGTLHPMAQTAFEEHGPYVQRRGASVGCASCHHGANAFEARDLTPDTLGPIDTARNEQVERLANDYWKSLVDPHH